MDFGQFLEEEMVARHSVENARGSEDDAVGGAEGGDEDGESDRASGPRSQDGRCGRGGDGFARGGGRGAERIEISDDGDEVETCERKGTEQERARESSLWFDDFSGAVRAELPTFVGPENGDHGQAEIREKRKTGSRRAERRGNFAHVMAERKKNGAEDHDDSDFNQRGPVLQIGAFACAPDVDGGNHRDHRDGDDRGLEWRERNNFGEIARKGASERGDRAAGNHQKQTPAIEKSGHATEAIANKNIEAAGFGIGGGAVGVGERAEEREDAADNPDEEGGADGAVELAKDQAGSEEDAGADDRADEEKEEVAFAKRAEKRGHSRGLIAG